MMAEYYWRYFGGFIHILPFLALAAIFALLVGCSEEDPPPKVSANLCLYLQGGAKLAGPYDTKKECDTAQENLPQGVCKPCQEKLPQQGKK